MARGGTREGNAGTPHPNRRDLDIPKPKHVPTGQTYGQAKLMEQALSSQPAGKPATPRVPVMDTRGNIPSLSSPSARPNEPVTTGLPVGPGAGPEALMSRVAQGNQELQVLRAIYMKYPNEDLRRLIEWTEQNL